MAPPDSADVCVGGRIADHDTTLCLLTRDFISYPRVANFNNQLLKEFLSCTTQAARIQRATSRGHPARNLERTRNISENQNLEE